MEGQFTSKMANGLWSFDSADDDSEYSSVMDFINTSKQSFGEALSYFYCRRHPETDAVSVRKELEKKAKEKKIYIASAGALDNWFKHGKRPKKSDQNRQTMFRLAFIMELNPFETAELFHKVYIDRAFNQRNLEEIVYYTDSHK